MKIRTGFVSNSSSSSFIILSTPVFSSILEAMGVSNDKDDYYDDWVFPEDQWEHYDYGLYHHKKTEVKVASICGEIQAIGLDLIELVNKDMKLSEMKVHLKEVMKLNFNVDISLSSIVIQSGELGNEA